MAVEGLVSNITGAATGAASDVAGRAVDTAGSFLPSFDITGLVPAGITGAEPIIIGFVFIVFIFAVRKVLGFVKNLVIIAVASAAFPFFLKAMGYNIAFSLPLVAKFVVFGVAVFAVFTAVKFIYRIFRRK